MPQAARAGNASARCRAGNAAALRCGAELIVHAFFTADTHIADPHILRMRPFSGLADHDEAVVARWNARVSPEDEVWHLGDVFGGIGRERCTALFARLHGVKRLVVGNHDSNRVLELPWASPPVDHARLTLKAASGAEVRLYLSHYPMRSWPGLWRGTRHLHGHTHSMLPGTRQSCDVGADAWDCTPASLDEVIARQDATETLPEELAVWAARRAGA